MQATKDRVLVKTKEAVATLLNHPLDAKVARELFLCTAGSVFRFSAAQTPWTTAELGGLLSLWTQAYKRAESLPDGTASDIYVFPKKWGSKELLTPYSVLAQELCNHLQRCLLLSACHQEGSHRLVGRAGSCQSTHEVEARSCTENVKQPDVPLAHPCAASSRSSTRDIMGFSMISHYCNPKRPVSPYML